MDRSTQIDELISRHEIYEVLTRYCRGVDRCDVELIRSVYHEDAMDDHGMFKGLGVQFAQWIVDWEKANIKLSQHFIGNFTCELQTHGDRQLPRGARRWERIRRTVKLLVLILRR